MNLQQKELPKRLVIICTNKHVGTFIVTNGHPIDLEVLSTNLLEYYDDPDESISEIFIGETDLITDNQIFITQDIT